MAQALRGDLLTGGGGTGAFIFGADGDFDAIIRSAGAALGGESDILLVAGLRVARRQAKPGRMPSSWQRRRNPVAVSSIVPAEAARPF